MSPGPAGAAAALCLLLGSCAVGPPAVTPTMTPTPEAVSSASLSAAPSPAPRVIGRGPERLHTLTRTRPAPPILSARFVVALVEDHCVDRDLATPTAGDPVFTILDRSYALPPTYVPDDLVTAAEAGLTGISGTKLVRSVVIEDLSAMRDAWASAGMTVAIDSAYRSYADQEATFAIWVARIGHDEAVIRTARPGHSEHQLGTAIDVSSPGWGGRFGDWAREAPEGAWMAEHAWEYGFVMSYPPGAQERTCFGYEPWHYRWVGREAAAEQRESGQVLRQFLADGAGG